MRKLVILCVGAAAILGHEARADQAAPPKPELVLRELVEGMPKGERQEIRVMTATLEPGAKTPFHSHRFPVTVHVLEGTFTMEMEGREPMTISAGQAFIEPPDVHMTGFNRGGGPAKVVIFYVSDPDTPFLDAVPQ
jgi:quercetin dioxygenase-like cupin family protein